MAKEDNTSGVQRAYAVLFAYVTAVVEEVGTEKAFGILSKVVEKRGEDDGRALVKKLGIKEGDIDSGLAVYSAFLAEGGIFHEVEKTRDRALIRVSKCPIYTAYYQSGFACDWLVEAMCKNMALPLITSILKQVNPRFRAMVRRYRSSSEDYCLEELVLEDLSDLAALTLEKTKNF